MVFAIAAKFDADRYRGWAWGIMWFTIAAMLASVGLLSRAMRMLPLGTAYMAWTGIGAIGAFTVGVLFLGESFSSVRVVAALLIMSGIVLMRLSSTA